MSKCTLIIQSSPTLFEARSHKGMLKECSSKRKMIIVRRNEKLSSQKGWWWLPFTNYAQFPLRLRVFRILLTSLFLSIYTINSKLFVVSISFPPLLRLCSASIVSKVNWVCKNILRVKANFFCLCLSSSTSLRSQKKRKMFYL